MADRIVVIKGGVIQQIGEPHEVYMKPINIFVATFIGSPQMNIFHGTVSEKGGDLTFSGPFSMNFGKRFAYSGEEKAVSVGIRPEDIEVGKDSERDNVAGEVILVEPIGSDTLINVEIAEEVSCKIRMSASSNVSEGDHIKLKIPPDKVHFFDSEGIRVASTRE
ncbi:MAG: ABC transporter ATP-binding protein, partial [Spirochaetota bacterium]